MIFLGCDWILSPQITLSELAQISDDHNVDLVFIGGIFVGEKGINRLKLAIKGDAKILQEFIGSLPKAFGMNSWYSVTESEYEQGELFSMHWNTLEDYKKSSWMDSIIRLALVNQQISGE